MAFQLDRLDDTAFALAPRCHRLIFVATAPQTLSDLLTPEQRDHATLQIARIAQVYEHRLSLRDLPEAAARVMADDLARTPGLRLVSLEHLLNA